jgi:predicted lipid carrier protein YhbT
MSADIESLNFAEISPEEFAGLVKNLPKSDLATIASGPSRERIADEIFGRMETRFKPDVAGRLRALIRWQVVDSGQPELVYETNIADQAITLRKGASEDEPRLTLTGSAVDMVRLFSGNASGTTLFMTRKLKVSGDLGLAAALTRYFDIPKA